MSRVLTSLCWAVLLTSCHDAPRTNPFDPALTPAVELQVALDDTAGTATLTWTRYEGKQSFREYQVLRNQIGLIRVDTLEHLTSVEQTAFVDTSLALDTDYEYWVSAVNTGGFAAPSERQRAHPLSLPVVHLQEPVFDSRTASASLKWTAYRGPRFKTYRVERRSAGLTPQVVGEVLDIADTSFVDRDLMGNTEYFYRVVVLTERDEAVASGERRGAFHQLVTTWPVEIDQDDYGRLSVEPGDRLMLLLANPDRVRLQTLDLEGQVREPEQVLYRRGGQPILPRSVATAVMPDGLRLLSLAFGETLVLLPFTAEGQPILQASTLFAEEFSEPLEEPERTLVGELRLWNLTGKYAAFDNVRIGPEEQPSFIDDFEAGNTQGWEASSREAAFEDGRVEISRDTVFLIHREPDTQVWQDVHVEVDVVVQEGQAGVLVGDQARLSSFLFTINAFRQKAILQWSFQPPPGVDVPPEGQIVEAPLTVLDGLLYRLSLDVVGGRVRASVKVQQPFADKITRDPQAHWSSLIGLEGGEVVLTEENRPYSISQEGARPNINYNLPFFEEPVSEVRVWEGQVGATEGQVLGLCLPRANTLLMGVAPTDGRFVWPFAEGLEMRRLGRGVGHEAGEFLYPLSFGVGPDGRLFVLDAGNARIQVFDAEGIYITQWGRRGTDEGQFDFGSGSTPEDFRGSVVVDSRGFIYVLDAGNQRIQKFEP